ncbi:MAG: formylglycine-generating enzyme family protein, partial [Candidatus Hydrogenedentes bacterium]|nr:formylglycine-generating enzyme family protein [Candidatus Hydrogenedentota bacterium]
GGALAALAVVALGIWSLVTAEAYRKTEAAKEPAPVSTEPRAVAPLEPTFAAYENIWEALHKKAEANVGQRGVLSALKDGDDFWAQAQQANDNGRAGDALDFADSAFRCYLALLMAPNNPGDMVFVKPGFLVLPGQQDIFVDGFFIDRTEVTLGQYRDFIKREEVFGPLPRDLDGWDNEYPVSDVSCLDAMAFAANAGGQLPTETQWARAASFDRDADDWASDTGFDDDDEPLYNFRYDSNVPVEPVGDFPGDESVFGCRDMVGNVSEWTRSSDAQKPTFGSIMMVCGGNYAEDFVPPLDFRRHMFFEMSAPQVGFRCVREIPTSLSAVRAYLDR